MTPHAYLFSREPVRWFFLVSLIIPFSIGIVGASLIDKPTESPLFGSITLLILYSLQVSWIAYRCKLNKANFQSLFYRSKDQPRLFAILGLIVVLICIFTGFHYLTLIPMSHVAPEFVEKIIKDPVFDLSSSWLSMTLSVFAS